jgi:hypothetical protein
MLSANTIFRRDGRRYAAGCSPRDEALIAPEEVTPSPPRRRYRPILRSVLAARRRWTPREMKLALGRALLDHNIGQSTFGRLIGLNESAMSRALGSELETVCIRLVAAALGYEGHGPADHPVFRLRISSVTRKHGSVPRTRSSGCARPCDSSVLAASRCSSTAC